MSTFITVGDKKYDCIMCWNILSQSNNIRLSQSTKDMKQSNIKYKLENDEKIPLPQKGNFWSEKSFFLENLIVLEALLREKKNIIYFKKPLNCRLCKKKNVSKLIYQYKNVLWDDGLYHYVYKHNMKPPSKFIRFILQNYPGNVNKCKYGNISVKGKISRLNKFIYVKIKANQLLILDALLEHGSTEIYPKKHEHDFVYSEHAGMLDFHNQKLRKIIVSGTTDRFSENDPDIFLPKISKDFFDFEYIFHTHPSTPKPGSRIKEGILYEFPSVNDILHFIHFMNHSKIQGSIVISPEGLYNIRKYIFNKTKFNFDNETLNIFASDFQMIENQIQSQMIKKHGNNMKKKNYFYNTIAQDTSAIEKLNVFLEKYNIHIDYFPRQKTRNNRWIIGTVYLPLCCVK